MSYNPIIIHSGLQQTLLSTNPPRPPARKKQEPDVLSHRAQLIYITINHG